MLTMRDELLELFKHVNTYNALSMDDVVDNLYWERIKEKQDHAWKKGHLRRQILPIWFSKILVGPKLTTVAPVLLALEKEGKIQSRWEKGTEHQRVQVYYMQ